MHTAASTKGYTLIEVLIASALFVGVLVIATASFTTAGRLRAATASQQATTETARFVAETLARDLRAATGRKEGASYAVYPYQFLVDGRATTQLGASGMIETTALETNRFDPTVAAGGTVTTRRYEFKTTGDGRGSFTVTEGANAPSSLVPSEFDVRDVHFRGLSHAVPAIRSQPFVQFEFTVIHRASGATQTIRSSVASRELL